MEKCGISRVAMIRLSIQASWESSAAALPPRLLGVRRWIDAPTLRKGFLEIQIFSMQSPGSTCCVHVDRLNRSPQDHTSMRRAVKTRITSELFESAYTLTCSFLEAILSATLCVCVCVCAALFGFAFPSCAAWARRCTSCLRSSYASEWTARAAGWCVDPLKLELGPCPGAPGEVEVVRSGTGDVAATQDTERCLHDSAQNETEGLPLP